MKKANQQPIDAKAFEAWCRRNDPHFHGVRRGFTREHLTALSHAVEATENANYTVSGAMLVGNEAEKAKNSSLQAKQNLPTDGSNPSQSNPFIEAFVNSPAAGATTLMDMARISTGFDPLDPSSDQNVQAYNDYINEILKNVMFHLEVVDKKRIQIKEQDFNTLIRDIAELFDGVRQEDESKIKDDLVKLAQAATTTKDTRQSTDLFVQNAVQVEDGNLRIYIYYSTVSMIVHEGKSTTNQTDYTVMRTRLKFQTEFWNEFTAGAVAQRHFKDLGDWLDGNTTRVGDDVANQKFCLKSSNI